MLTADQVRRAIEGNDNDVEARRLLPKLRAVFGRPGAEDAFDVVLVHLLADYQFGAGLTVDGRLGPKTRAKLAAQRFLDGEPCGELWALPHEEPAVHYLAVADALGHPTAAQARPLLLGVRGAYPFADRSHRLIHAPRYDDTFILLYDGAVSIFRGATHAYQLRSRESPDQNRDGVGDVGSIRPGRYKLTLQGNDPPIFTITTDKGGGQLPAFRDTDGDGYVSEAEAEASTKATAGGQVKAPVGAYATNVLFHPGFDVIKPGGGRTFSSIACQTAPLADMKRLRSCGRVHDFVLTTAVEAARAARLLRMPAPNPELIT